MLLPTLGKATGNTGEGTRQRSTPIVSFGVKNVQPVHSNSIAFQTLSIHIDIHDDIH